MTINTARFIDPHPVPVFETHFPQFHVYPNIPQNLMRPTWKGTTRGLGATAIEYGGGPGRQIAIPLSQATRAFAPPSRGYQDYSRSIRRLGALPPALDLWIANNKTWLLMGGSLLVGLGVGYWLGKR